MARKEQPDSRRVLSRRESLVLASTPVAAGLGGCLTRSAPPASEDTDTPQKRDAATIRDVALTITTPVESGVATPVGVTVTVAETAATAVSAGLEVRPQAATSFETVGDEQVELAAGESHQLTFSVTPQASGTTTYRAWATLPTGGRVTTAMTKDTTPARRSWGEAVELANGLNVTVSNPRFRGGYPPAAGQSAANGSLTAPGSQYAIVDVAVTNTATTSLSLPAREAFRLAGGQTIHPPVSVDPEATGVYPASTAIGSNETINGTIGYRIGPEVVGDTLQVVHQSVADELAESWQARWGPPPQQ